jgi:hypothetical protein
MQSIHPELKLSTSTHNYISAVVSPFDATNPAQIPDLNSDNTLSIRDAIEGSTPTNETASALSGALFWISFGYSYNQATYGEIPGLLYSFNWLALDSNGLPILNASGKYAMGLFQNYPTICGSSTSVLAKDALMQSLRVVACGLRILPTIEMVTDPSQLYCRYIIGTQLSSSDIASAITNASNFFTLAKNAPSARVFSNNVGCSSRFDPFQTDFITDMRDISQFYSNTIRWDAIRLPSILVNFSAPIAALNTLPIIFSAQLWLEGSLKQPTPIFSTSSPVDPVWSVVKPMFSLPCTIHPVVTEGHSFPLFAATAPAFLKTVSNGLRSASQIGARALNVGRQVVRFPKRVNRIARRNRKARRANKRNPTRKGKVSRTIMPGTRKPPLVVRKVRNY